jgi:hypothetical protein
MSDSSGSPITQARTIEAFDRPISLIDTTRPQERENNGEGRKTSRSPSWRQLAKRPTKGSVREGLARWKYSKWQQDRFASASDLDAQNGEGAEGPSGEQTDKPKNLRQEGVSHTEIEASDFALRQGSQDRGRARLKKTKEEKPKSKTKAEKQPYEVDVLYENQRGWFFFGIPLYSHSSLLNFDPSPWMTRDGKDSAVNITNAQVPDPSWEWAWKTWYTDMSYDVDEEGWQYSFSFSRKFSWHGTHPWFHCFVRRRRWLRKRVKKQERRMKNASDMAAAHTLTADYFTIHSKRGRSPGSGLENTTTRGSSHVSRRSDEEMDLPPEDIKDIPSLMKALRLATIDREKIDVVKKFVENGGDELVYLEENIPEIMAFFVFQVSRRQLLEYLSRRANEASKEQSEDKGEKQRVIHLRNAVRAANSQIGGLEYWSDRQHVLKTVDENSRSHRSRFSESSVMTIPKENNPVDVIKGIAGKAEVGIDSTRKVLSPPPENNVGPSYVELEDESKPKEEQKDKTEDAGKEAAGKEDAGKEDVGREDTEKEDIKKEDMGKEDAETKHDKGAETPISLPPDSIKVDD